MKEQNKVLRGIGIVLSILLVAASFYLLYQLLWGYYCQFFILVALYPDISFFAFFGVCFCLSHTLCFIFSLLFGGRVPRYFIFYISLGTRLLVHHLLWLQHTPIHQKRTPTFYF